MEIEQEISIDTVEADRVLLADLQDYETLGSWIVDVMNLLDTIPRNEYTINAEPSIVNFRFYVGASKLLDVRVPIKKYWAEASGKSGVEVFLLFYSEP